MLDFSIWTKAIDKHLLTWFTYAQKFHPKSTGVCTKKISLLIHVDPSKHIKSGIWYKVVGNLFRETFLMVDERTLNKIDRTPIWNMFRKVPVMTYTFMKRLFR